MANAYEAKKQEITMLSIGVTLRVDMQELIDIASEMPKSLIRVFSHKINLFQNLTI